jgi:hypothetical protein
MEFMSIWEVAHRWAGTDPDVTNPDNLPSEVKDRLRDLLVAVDKFINLFNVSGEEELDTYIPIIGTIRPNKNLQKAKQLLLLREYSKDDLNTFFVQKKEVEEWLRIENEPVPSFWFSEDDVQFHNKRRKEIHCYSEVEPPSSQKPKKLRDCQIAKIQCQEIAKRLWLAEPKTRIAHMVNHEEVKIKGGGNRFTDKIVAKWLREVAPEDIRGRRGRSKKEE